MQISVDCETLLKSLVFMAEGVATTIGENGARAMMRLAGRRAAVDLLEALPLVLEIDEAIKRVGPVMVELGFVGGIAVVDDMHLVVSGNAVVSMLQRLEREPRRHPVCYYAIGLFEGFVHILSKTRVSSVQHELRDDTATWTLQE